MTAILTAWRPFLLCLLGWLVLQRPLVALTEWLRHQPGFRASFAERASDGPMLDAGQAPA